MSFSHLLKTFAQFVAVTFSMAINAVLIILVVYHSPDKIGNYKYLMIYFCLISMFYAAIDFTVQPYLHSYGSSFSMIMDLRGSVFQNFHYVAFLLTSSLAGCFGMSIYAISINFVYRFFAIQRANGTKNFSGFKLFFWLSIPIVAGIAWLSVGVFLMDYDEEFAEYLSESIYKSYGLDWHYITLTGCMYFRSDGNGGSHWSVSDTTGAAVLTGIMNTAFFIILYFGYRTKKMINCLTTNKGDTRFSQRLQKQLYNALVAQTLIPITFLFIPIGILFSAPLFGFDLERWSYLVTFFYSFYPVVDPIPTIFFIDEYRTAFLNFFRRTLNRNQVTPVKSIDIVPELP
ncbi:Protein CBG11638 [Caenorhabditis briggsae]|uniref:Serpentine receptor class r-10 n=1 Tax=Caenorhabditis briggsae TaxID=6238 RepID=A8XDP4_CAEBR|nr:Protein CBG11638 [Caenorhabditis briggsae]CAP30764.1 Protein CBG11638 [Caenorhabditis briggsae]